MKRAAAKLAHSEMIIIGEFYLTFKNQLETDEKEIPFF